MQSSLPPLGGNYSIYDAKYSLVLPVKPTLRHEVKVLLYKANALSERILGTRQGVAPSGKFVNSEDSEHHYKQLFYEFFRGAVACLATTLGQDREIRLIAGAVSFIVSLASIYYIGQGHMERLEAIADEQPVRYEQNMLLPTYKQYKSGNKDMGSIKKILAFEEQIFIKIRRHAEFNLAVRVAVFAASLLGLITAVWGTPVMIAWSFGLGAVTSVGWFVVEGFSFGVAEQRRAAEQMRQELTSLRLRTKF